MSSVQNLRELINQRLTAAAEEIFTEFEKTIVQYEEEIDRQRRLLENIWKPQITQHTADLALQHVCKERWVLAEQKVCNQERNSSLDQEDPELPQIKEEQEELCSSLDGQQLVPDHETHAFMLIQCKSKCEQLSREIFRIFEKTVVQYEEKVDRQRRQLDIVWKPKMKLHSIELTQQHVCMEEEILTEQQFCNQQMNPNLDHEDSKPPWIKEEQEDICTSVFQEDTEPLQIKEEQEELCTGVDMEDPDPSATKEQEELCTGVDMEDPDPSATKEEQEELCTGVDMEDPDPSATKEEQEELCTGVDQEEPELPQIKEEQDEVCTSQEEEQLVLKQEIDIFVVSPAYEESDHSEPEPNSDQFLSHNSPVRLKQKKRNGSHSNNVDNSPASESQCDTDTGKKSVKCGICGKTFKFMCYLKKHYLSHTGEKPYTCETCGTCFSQSGSLKLHMITHTGEKPYPCQICGKNFTLSRSLKIHMRLHTGEKPYPCETCGKSFTLSHGLKNHMRIHTAEKPYACEICGKSFNYSAYLKVHMTSHTGEKPYSCTFCEKRFCYPSALRKHIRIHTGERP